MQHQYQDSSPTGDQNQEEFCSGDQDWEDQADQVGQDQDQEDQADLDGQAAMENSVAGPRFCQVGDDETRRQDHDMCNAMG